MTQNSRNQPPSKESQEHANTQRDEPEKLASPDDDFPVDSPGVGGGARQE
jgi:hypothetical protein